MQLDAQVLPCVFCLFSWGFFYWRFRPREHCGYWLFNIVVPPMGLQTPSAPWVLSLAPSLETLYSIQWMTVSMPLQSHSGDSYIRLLSARACWHLQYVWVWWLFMGWIPRWCSLWKVIPLVSAPNFVSVTPSMGILFPLLRRIEVSTLWSSFFLSFTCFANCILGILSFWANIHLSVSAYHVCPFVIGLPHSGWYPPDPSISPFHPLPILYFLLSFSSIFFFFSDSMLYSIPMYSSLSSRNRTQSLFLGPLPHSSFLLLQAFFCLSTRCSVLPTGQGFSSRFW